MNIFGFGGGLLSTTRLDTSPAPIPTIGISPVVRKYFPETWVWDCKTVRFVVNL